MSGRLSTAAEPQEPVKERLLADLHGWERQLAPRSLEEAIRLIESEKADKLTGRHLRSIAEYDAITIDGQCFFDKAFSSGKEVAACLALAMEIGWREVLEDLVRLRAALGARPGTAATSIDSPGAGSGPAAFGSAG